MKECRNCNSKFQSIGWKCPLCGYQPEFINGHFLLGLEFDKDLGFHQDRFQELFELESANFWFKSRNHLIIWAISNYFLEAEKFLEIGCGTGFVLSGIKNAYPQLNIIGSDISSVGLSFALKRTHNVEMVQFDATSIPYVNEFDFIGALDVLEHVEDDAEVLRQMHKAVVKGGGVIITVPQHHFLWSQADEQACHKRRYSKKDLSNIVSLTGFDIVRITSFVSLIFPAMLLSRLLKKRLNKGTYGLNELNLPVYINNTFEKILCLERVMINAGVNMPFGGSLLLIARKT